MEFKATEEQVKKMAALAVNASAPMGLGILHFQKKEYQPEEFPISIRGIYLDYVDGRMVKLNIFKSDEGTWRVADETSYDYQSWKSKYDSYKELAEAAGVAFA